MLISNNDLWSVGDRVVVFRERARIEEVGARIRVRFVSGGGAWVRREDITDLCMHCEGDGFGLHGGNCEHCDGTGVPRAHHESPR